MIEGKEGLELRCGVESGDPVPASVVAMQQQQQCAHICMKGTSTSCLVLKDASRFFSHILDLSSLSQRNARRPHAVDLCGFLEHVPNVLVFRGDSSRDLIRRGEGGLRNASAVDCRKRSIEHTFLSMTSASKAAESTIHYISMVLKGNSLLSCSVRTQAMSLSATAFAFALLLCMLTGISELLHGPLSELPV